MYLAWERMIPVLVVDLDVHVRKYVRTSICIFNPTTSRHARKTTPPRPRHVVSAQKCCVPTYGTVPT